VAPLRTNAKAAVSSGRFLCAPEAFSSKIFSHPADRSASSCKAGFWSWLVGGLHVPHELPASDTTGRGYAALGCRRAYRLRGSDHPAAGRGRGVAGKGPVATFIASTSNTDYISWFMVFTFLQ